MEYQEINARTIDRWVKNGREWGTPISHEAYIRAKQGDWSVVLTPNKAVPAEWFGCLRGKKVLGHAVIGKAIPSTARDMNDVMVLLFGSFLQTLREYQNITNCLWPFILIRSESDKCALLEKAAPVGQDGKQTRRE